MKNKLVTLILFFSFFLSSVNPAHALNITDYFVNFIKSISFAPKYKIDTTSQQKTTQFNSNNPVGMANRIPPFYLQNKLKFEYLKSFVKEEEGYKNIELGTCTNFSDPVDLIQLSIFAINYYNLNIDKESIAKFLEKHKTVTLQGNTECFKQIFTNFYHTPQGNDLKKLDSQQTNTIIKVPIPANAQIESDGNLKENSKKNLDVLHRNLIPHNSIESNSSTKEIKTLFEGYLIPEKDKK